MAGLKSNNTKTKFYESIVITCVVPAFFLGLHRLVVPNSDLRSGSRWYKRASSTNCMHSLLWLTSLQYVNWKCTIDGQFLYLYEVILRYLLVINASIISYDTFQWQHNRAGNKVKHEAIEHVTKHCVNYQIEALDYWQIQVLTMKHFRRSHGLLLLLVRSSLPISLLL